MDVSNGVLGLVQKEGCDKDGYPPASCRRQYVYIIPKPFPA
jgi:hypothetical protein